MSILSKFPSGVGGGSGGGEMKYASGEQSFAVPGSGTKSFAINNLDFKPYAVMLYNPTVSSRPLYSIVATAEGVYKGYHKSATSTISTPSFTMRDDGFTVTVIVDSSNAGRIEWYAVGM